MTHGSAGAAQRIVMSGRRGRRYDAFSSDRK